MYMWALAYLCLCLDRLLFFLLLLLRLSTLLSESSESSAASLAISLASSRRFTTSSSSELYTILLKLDKGYVLLETSQSLIVGLS